MDIIPIFGFLGFIIVSCSGFLPSKKHLMNKYSKYDINELYNISAVSKKYKNVFFILTFIIPMPLSLFFPILNSKIFDLFVVFSMMIIFTCVFISGISRRIEKVVNYEIAVRIN